MSSIAVLWKSLSECFFEGCLLGHLPRHGDPRAHLDVLQLGDGEKS